jgi:hypothetical protein
MDGNAFCIFNLRGDLTLYPSLIFNSSYLRTIKGEEIHIAIFMIDFREIQCICYEKNKIFHIYKTNLTKIIIYSLFGKKSHLKLNIPYLFEFN